MEEVNFTATNKQGLSLVQMVGLIKFTLDFKTALNYKLNTMSYKKFQLILTLVISYFSNNFSYKSLGIENISIPNFHVSTGKYEILIYYCDFLNLQKL